MPGRPSHGIRAHTTLWYRQIQAADDEIEALVCELYGLTEEGIAIIKGWDH
jgi:hypothetical protein